MSVGEKQRKVRSDKKIDIKPFIDIELKNSIYRLAGITDSSIMKVCELLVLHPLYENEKIIENLSSHLKRDVRLYGRWFMANEINEELYEATGEENKRISFRLKKKDYEVLSHLAFAFDCSKAKVAGVLLYESITDEKFIDAYMHRYIHGLDREQRRELVQLLDYVRKETNQSYSFADLLTLLVENPIKWVFPD